MTGKDEEQSVSPLTGKAGSRYPILAHYLKSAKAARAIAFLVVLLVLLIALCSETLRLQLVARHLVLGLILSGVALAVVPARIWPAAFPLAIGASWLFDRMSALKERATGLPLTYIDLVTNLREPHIVVRALGFHGSMIGLVLGFGLVAALLLVLMLRAFGLPSVRRVLLSVLEGGSMAAAGLLVLGMAGRDVRDRLTELYPEVALDLWQSESQRELSRRVGPAVYVAYTFSAGDQEFDVTTGGRAKAIPRDAIVAAADKFINFPTNGARKLPNIVIYHAESTFDPNIVFRLSKRVNLPLWDRGPYTQSLGPLAVNVVGGGSHVTEFEVLTGVDSRGFGYQGYYTHQSIGPRVRRALPSVLADKGYENTAFYTETGTFFGVEAAFRRYGFHRFFDQSRLGLRGDWTNTDRDVVQNVIARGALSGPDRPRLVFISSLENHGPHRCVNFESRSELISTFEGNTDFALDCSLNEYLRRAASTSAAVASLTDELVKLEAASDRPWLLVVYGDHQPWSFTDGDYSTAAGLMNAGDMRSFAKFRRGRSQRLTLYHILSSVRGILPAGFPEAIPASLLPTLMSAYAARTADDLYLPENLLAFAQCGTDHRVASCPLKDSIAQATRTHLLKD